MRLKRKLSRRAMGKRSGSAPKVDDLKTVEPARLGIGGESTPGSTNLELE